MGSRIVSAAVDVVASLRWLGYLQVRTYPTSLVQHLIIADWERFVSSILLSGETCIILRLSAASTRPAAGSIDSTIMPLRTVDDVGKDEFSEYFVLLLNTLGSIMYAFLFQI